MSSPTTEHTPAVRPTLANRVREYAAGSGTIWILGALVALVIAFTVLAPTTFASAYNVRSLFTDAAILLVLGVGMTFVIITAGIDLSVGSVLVFSGVVSAQVMSAFGGTEAGLLGVFAGLLVALLSGVAWGALNGVLIGVFGIPPLIVTLGTFGAALGLAKVLTNGVDDRNVPTILADTIGTGTIGGIPWLVIIAMVVTVLGALLLGLTRFGRHTKAIGSNAEGARRVGVAVKPQLIKVYALAGLLAGLGGFLSLARFSTTTIAGHTTDNLTVIAAVVLGGTSLFGGIGSVVGTAIGVFIPAVLQNGFVILGIQPFWQEFAVGVVLILAVFFDQYRRRARSKGASRRGKHPAPPRATESLGAAPPAPAGAKERINNG
ncbi:ABC transporter permease [Glaciibacter superstes]|uniref:ABC transporter permease n=1 Tax=Glaciibacter superstes TaxID=501023 RepID=UPI0003B69D02|nr:ABC transporter permease [Glaciibacter superstes]